MNFTSLYTVWYLKNLQETAATNTGKVSLYKKLV